jgi:membrane peptidoglycan carboxypeptidase
MSRLRAGGERVRRSLRTGAQWLRARRRGRQWRGLRRWRRRWRWRGLRRWSAAIAGVVLALTGGAAVFVDSVTLPPQPVVPQASTLYYSDGHTVLARVGITDRTDVSLASVPEPVRLAVLAAEDRDFYGESAISLRGVLRAIGADAFGTGSEGASTITQQYVRNAFLTQDRTASRKAKEAALAIKVEHRYPKNEILERYLNTVYFGRGAYGIQAAADAYFGVTVDRLTVRQGAVLAALIKDPWGFDPAVDPGAAKDRYRWILGAMVSLHWADSSVLDDPYPAVADQSPSTQALSGPLGLVVDAVESELAAKGISRQTLRTAGLRVVTTIDAGAERSAIDRTTTMLAGQPFGLHAALVAEDPQTGGVVAYYGGDEGSGYFDDARAPRPPASTFKPIVLAQALRQNISAQSRWDGSAPRLFPDRYGVPLVNHAGLECADCTLAQAMVESLNTSYYAVAERVGPARVAALAHTMGVPARYGSTPTLVDTKGDPAPGRTRADIALGRYPVAPTDLATVYATFAAGGVRPAQHVVATVNDGTKRWYTAARQSQRVVDATVAADVTNVLAGVVEADGTVPGHPAAGKTGTQQYLNTADNQDAWMAGYTPQLAAVVWLGRATPSPIRDISGKPIEGDGLPEALWRQFLSDALAGRPAAALPPPAHLGRTGVGDARRSAPSRGAQGPGPRSSISPTPMSPTPTASTTSLAPQATKPTSAAPGKVPVGGSSSPGTARPSGAAGSARPHRPQG